ncbi:MAG: hypothetical protein Q4D90_00845 [bacterium]|nr:hypothetical protein [bacterium]
MLQFLEAGRGVYVVAAICILGILSKLAVNSFYKRAIKQTENMAATTNKFLKGFRQRMENTYWINQGIYNARAYIERQIFSYRFLGVSLNAWDAFSGQAVLLSLLAGGMGAYLSYWYQMDSSYIVLYGAAGAMGALLLLLTEQTVKSAQKQEQLLVCLQDYIENSMGRRMNNRMEKEEKEGAQMAAVPQGNKEHVIVSMERGNLRTKAEEKEVEESSQSGSGASIPARRAAGMVGKRRSEREEGSGTVREVEGVRAAKTAGKAAESGNRSSTAQMESLRKSMEQAAAGKEKAAGADLTKILEPEQIQLLGEVLREYLK